jgi:hypothetical protein
VKLLCLGSPQLIFGHVSVHSASLLKSSKDRAGAGPSERSASDQNESAGDERERRHHHWR